MISACWLPGSSAIWNSCRRLSGTSLRVGGVASPDLMSRQVEARVAVAGELERAAAGQQRVERGRQREGVGCGARLRGRAEGLGRRPGDRHAAPARLAVVGRGDAEVGQRRTPVLRDEDVGGLDVSVQDPDPMGALDRARDLHAQREHLGNTEAVTLVLHAEVGLGTVLP